MEKTLPRIDEGGALASVMEHCGYCGGSLARVGLDFRPMLPPLFADAANGIFTRAMDVVAGEFERTVETHRWVYFFVFIFVRVVRLTTCFVHRWATAPSSAARRQKERGVDGDEAGDGGDGSSSAPDPPYALLEHVPVAALTNGVLAALNDLRHCALPQLRQPLADELRACVERCAHALMRVEAQRFGGGRGWRRGSERRFAIRVCGRVQGARGRGGAVLGRVLRQGVQGWGEAGGRERRGERLEKLVRIIGAPRMSRIDSQVVVLAVL